MGGCVDKKKKMGSSKFEGIDYWRRLMYNRAVTISLTSIEQTSLKHSSRRGAGDGDSGQGRADQTGSDVTLPTIEFQFSTGQSTVNSEIVEPHDNTTTSSSPRYCSARTPAMPSLILVVFVIQLAIHLISTFGGQAIIDLVPLNTSHI